MKHPRFKIVITYVLLLYFLGFVVPPVSAILPSSAPADFSGGQYTPDVRTGNDGLMLIDLALWEILNRTKRNDELSDRFTIDNPSSADLIECVLVSASVNCLVTAQEAAAQRINNRLFYTNNPRSTRSGLSPPLAA